MVDTVGDLQDKTQLTPMTLTYMKIIKCFLTTLGSWPGYEINKKRKWFQNIIARFYATQGIVIVAGQFRYLFIKFEELSLIDVGDRLFTLFITLLNLYRTWLPFLSGYRTVINKFISEFHLIHFKHQSDYFNKIYNQINVLSYYYTVFMSSALVSCTLLFNSSALYNNCKNSAFTNKNENYSLQFSVHYSLPGLSQEEKFKFITVYNVFLSYVCAVLMNVNDTIVTIVVFQIIGHIKSLQHNLAVFPTPKLKQNVPFESFRGEKTVTYISAEVFSIEENTLLRAKIIQCLKHHKFIVNFTDEFSTFFGPMIGLNYLFHVLSCCLILLECTMGPPEVLLRFGPLGGAVFFQLCHISIVFEVVGSESEKLIDAVYLIPWECMNVSNQRTMCILLHRFQTPVQVRALGMTPVGVRTMLGILKATFSYYTLLQSLSR